MSALDRVTVASLRRDSLGESVMEVVNLESKLHAEMMNGAFDLVEAYLHRDLIYLHSNGTRLTRDEFIARCRAGSLSYRIREHSVDSVVIRGDLAFVTGRTRSSTDVRGFPLIVNNCTLAVWLREDDVWRVLAFEPSGPAASSDLTKEQPRTTPRGCRSAASKATTSATD